MKVSLKLLVICLINLPLLAWSQPYTFTRISDSSVFEYAYQPRINNKGDVSFTGELSTGEKGIFVSDGYQEEDQISFTTIIKSNELIFNIGNTGINLQGSVLFKAADNFNRGNPDLYIGSGDNQYQKIFLDIDEAVTPEKYSYSSILFNNTGEILYLKSPYDVPYHLRKYEIFSSEQGLIADYDFWSLFSDKEIYYTPITRYNRISPLSLNNNGDILFYKKEYRIDSGDSCSKFETSVIMVDPVTTTIVDNFDCTKFSYIRPDADLNDYKTIVYVGDEIDGSKNKQVVKSFDSKAKLTSTIASAASDIDISYWSFENLKINNGYSVVFRSRFNHSIIKRGSLGIFMGPNPKAFKVIVEDDLIEEKVVKRIGGHDFNDLGQVVFTAVTDDGKWSIYRADPTQTIYLDWDEPISVDFIPDDSYYFVNDTIFKVKYKIDEKKNNQRIMFNSLSDNEKKTGILKHLHKLLFDSGVNIPIIDSRNINTPPENAIIVRFGDRTKDVNGVKGVAFDVAPWAKKGTGAIDRFNIRKDGEVAVFIKSIDKARTIADIIAHEVGHALGLIHINPLPLSGVEIMDRQLPNIIKKEQSKFYSSPTETTDRGQLWQWHHNPLFHIRRYTHNDSEESLINEGIQNFTAYLEPLTESERELIESVDWDIGKTRYLLSQVVITSLLDTISEVGVINLGFSNNEPGAGFSLLADELNLYDSNRLSFIYSSNSNLQLTASSLSGQTNNLFFGFGDVSSPNITLPTEIGERDGKIFQLNDDETFIVVGQFRIQTTVKAEYKDDDLLNGETTNKAPIALCQDIVVSTDLGSCSASADVDAGSFDPDDDPITLVQSPPGPYLLGTTNVQLSVTDDANAVSSCSATVTVQDNEPPNILTATTNKTTIWPPNHKMIPITFNIQSQDNCDVAPVCRVVSVSSNEQINGVGDGNTEPDWEITGNLSIKLRAERSGKGDGRIYTNHIECSDKSGNHSKINVDINVPLHH